MIYRKRKSYPNEILPGKLYLGNQFDASDPNVLRNLKITHVVNVTSEIPNHFEKEGKILLKIIGISYMRVLVKDHDEEMIQYYFPRVYGFIDSAIFSQKKARDGQIEIEDIKRDLYRIGRSRKEAYKITKESFVYGLDSLLKTTQNEMKKKTIKTLYNEFELLINSAPDNKNRVLVHCAMGISRSASIVIMYLMKKFCTTFESVCLLLILFKETIIINALIKYS